MVCKGGCRWQRPEAVSVLRGRGGARSVRSLLAPVRQARGSLGLPLEVLLAAESPENPWASRQNLCWRLFRYVVILLEQVGGAGSAGFSPPGLHAARRRSGARRLRGSPYRARALPRPCRRGPVWCGEALGERPAGGGSR